MMDLFITFLSPICIPLKLNPCSFRSRVKSGRWTVSATDPGSESIRGLEISTRCWTGVRWVTLCWMESVRYWLGIGQVSVRYWSGVTRLSVGCQSCVSRVSVGCHLEFSFGKMFLLLVGCRSQDPIATHIQHKEKPNVFELKLTPILQMI